MKKLLFILSAILVSVTGWAGLNPYAYGLKSYLNEDKSELTMIYTLNANAETSKENNPTAIGVQVYIFEKASGNIVKTLTNGKITQGTCTLTVATADLPKDVPLSWKVVVHGNAKQTQPAVVHDRVSNNRPNATHGVAVDKNPESPSFGSIYYTEASSGNLNSTWDWMEAYTRPCVWQYTPQLTYSGHFYKDKENNVDVSNFVTTSQVEPHRVRISDDNRIFVSSCYADATTVVWEYMGNNNFNKVITRTGSYGKVLGMDVWGSGNNLKILLCYISGNKLTFREYALGSAGSISGSGTDKGTFTDQTLVISGSRVGVAYDDNGESFWFAIDRSTGYSSRIFHMTKSGSAYTCSAPFKCPLYTGGDGLFVKGNLLVKGIATSDGNTAEGRLYFYTINNDGSLTQKWTDLYIWSSYWVNDIDMDYAGNLYIASAYAGNAIAISIPYDGRRETVAMDKYTFTIAKPVPNILVTDLRYDIVRGKNQYEFSFNVNTKPEEAQIRFYESYDAMKNSLNVVNADNYDGTNNNKPLFVYNIPSDKLKQGRIAVKLGAVGGQVDANDVITNDRLPSGVLYWSVYVKTRKSSVFAPIYTQPLTGEHEHNRLHATVNTHPETDNFGYIYATDYKTNNVCRLMVYSIGDANVNDEDEAHITSNTRYALLQNLTINQVVNTRRPAVAPDGYVFLTDFGASTDKIATLGPAGFDQGGIWVFDPNLLQNKSISGSASLTRFHSADETSSGVSFLGIGISTKLYKTNTYDEIARFPSSYNDTERLKNGYRIFNVGNNDGSIKHSMNLTDGTQVAIKTQSKGYGTTLKDVGGDANGNISIKATSDGVWLCQHRSGTAHENPSASSPNPDNFETTALMFQNNSGKRAFSSFEATVNGKSLSQTSTSIMQSTPGAGMTVSANEKYLYVVNHEGNILEFQIGGTSDAKTLTHTRTFLNTTQFKTISTLNFDYAGNLVASTDKSYPDMETQIVVFTMPYDRANAREIQAPNSCRMIPERIAHLDMDKDNLDDIIKEHQNDHPTGCAIDLYRPLQGGEFNTICLPCTLDLTTLPEGHPLYEAELKEYTGLNLNTVGGEKVLELVFTDVSDKIIIANKPYIIQPEENYNSIIRFAGPLQLTNTTGGTIEKAVDGYNITYQGIIPYQEITPIIQDGVSLTLMLVADNRLAEMTTTGYKYGFRGYFKLNQPLPKGMRTRITTSKGTATNTTIVVDGKKVNVEKFLREGRVYIRVGETLYTINGEKVE
jgi:hypothetical protein